MITERTEEDSYGIVIDSGSSGSRLHIFKWINPASIDTKQHKAEEIQSVPKIEQSKDWIFKSNPGLSSYEHKTNKAFSEHIKPLLKKAEKIIPSDKIKNTPVFVQATAGMRLLPKKNRNAILKDVCNGIKSSTNFLMEDCDVQVQIIDGETEGIYGWLGLNYLLGHFNNYNEDEKDHFTMGFMDMGGASAQIAFVPSDKDEIERHKEDIPTVYLRNVNGDLQEWHVFVGTWLGFGANQARKRYLAQLINALPENTNNYDDDDFTTRVLSDPCMPKGSKSEFEFKDTEFMVIGLGDFEQCSKSMYPLLLKNLPCEDEPCLFNGVHAPKIDFTKDKFVGMSEFWYTPNDIFNLGGEYSFDKFNKEVQKFCNTDWDTIEDNLKHGEYNSIPEDFLKDSCFKSNWIINVLHEGFEFPQADNSRLDTSKNTYNYPMFQSLDKILDIDLSWTLGRILLYASGMVPILNNDLKVGIVPSVLESKNSGRTFIPGFVESTYNSNASSSNFLKYFLVFTLLVLIIYSITGKKISNLQLHFSKINNLISIVKYKVSDIRSKFGSNGYFEPLSDLEAGEIGRATFSNKKEPSYRLKSKSMFNLNTSKTDKSHNNIQDENDDIARPLSQGLQSSQSSANIRPAFSMADFSKFQNP